MANAVCDGGATHTIRQSHIGKSGVGFLFGMAEKHNEITLEKRNQSKVVRTSTLPKQLTQQPEKSHNYMIIANAVFYGGTEAEKVYLGNDLVWEKSSTPKPAHQIMGKFTDDSTSTDWKCQINAGDGFPLPVDPVTKEFVYDLQDVVDSYKTRGIKFTRCNKLETIDLSNYTKSSDITVMHSMFDNCTSLKSVRFSELVDTSNVIKMDYMFQYCESLTSLNLSYLNTSKVEDMNGIFKGCTSLISLDLSGWDVSNVKSMNYSFTFYDSSCKVLTTVLGPITGIGASWTNTINLDLSSSPLTNASAMVFINGLAEVTEAKTIQFKASTYDTLTPEQIAVATSKGWNVVRSA